MSFPKYKHDPDSTVDYEVDWSAELTAMGDDTIVSAEWVVPTGITLTDESNTTTTHTIWLTGGTLGASYTVTSRITTAGGRIEDQSITLSVVEL